MRFWVPIASAEDIVAAFSERLRTACLPGTVTMVVRPGGDGFAVTMRSGRISVLSFMVTSEDSGSTVRLVDEAVSRSHETFRRDVVDWIYWHARAMGGGQS